MQRSSDETRISLTTKISFATLCILHVMSFCDRYIVAATVPILKKEFKINNYQAGLLHSSSFILQVFAAPIYGYLGDRYNRKLLLILSVFFLDVIQLISSFVTEYWLFFIPRLFFGVGHAGFVTVAVPLIGDLFLGRSRSAALSLFYLGIPVGVGLGYLEGNLAEIAFDSWRWTFKLNTLISFISLILVAATLKEPARGLIEEKVFSPALLIQDVRYLYRNQTYIIASFALICIGFVAQVLSFWGPYVFHLGAAVKYKGRDIVLSRTIFGIMCLISSTLGLTVGCLFTARCRKRIRQIDPIIIAVDVIISIPLLFASFFLITYNLPLCYFCLFVGLALINMNWPLTIDVLMEVVLPNKRPLALSIQIFMQHGFGSVLGPYVVGRLSVYLQSVGLSNREDFNLFLSLLYACFGCSLTGFVGSILLFTCSFFLIKDAVKTGKWGRGEGDFASDFSWGV